MSLIDSTLMRCTGCGKPMASAPDHIDTETVHVIACAHCGHSYPITGGVVRAVPSEAYAGSFGYQWNIHKRTQMDSYTGLSLSTDRLFTATKWPRKLPGQTILEAGSGAGRFTEVLASTTAEVYTFDLSSAVNANRQTNGANTNVRFFQANMLDMPFLPHSFDHVICLGVIQHTPDPGLFFKSLARQVKPGGTLTIDCYAKNLRSLLSWKYVLRPITKRIRKESLYKFLENMVPPMVPLSAFLQRAFGPAGMRLLPILQYAHWGLSPELNRQWAILDTFDMYSPEYDLPQTLQTVRQWYLDAGFTEIDVRYGINGVVASGRMPKAFEAAA